MFIGFNDEMKKILKSLVGKKLLNFEGDFEEKWNRVYSYLRINTNDGSIDLTNEESYIDFIEEKEDVTCLKCQTSKFNNIKDEFKLSSKYVSSNIIINDVVKEINIITEIIIKEGAENIEYDKGIEIVTENHSYLFYTKSWFDEYIYYSFDNNRYDELYPIDEDLKVWKNGENVNVKIERKKELL